MRIPEPVLVAGKVVPPAPVRRRPGVPAVTAEELAAIAARAWPATEARPLGGWTLRAAGGFTRRANSVLVAGEPGMPVAEALASVVRWYAARDLTPYLQVPDTSPWVPALDRYGWIREADTLIRTAPLPPLTSLASPGSLPGRGAEDVLLTRTPGPGWLAAYHRTGDLADAALEVVSGGPSVWFATAPGAIGRAVVDGSWALFGAMEVEPAMRRQGRATAVLGALARRAYDEGATAAYLQVEAANTGALALYDRLGFVGHHGYHYRRPPRPVA
ncbi:GNAT family N-acetyltransferase [Streptomyces sp. NBC_01190]|uniref:GNAT family N-acetyltransferase n=1 Tax=Streptomyces sp. NBC_01190 TaxID=2903767 RepID=UPI00386563C1